LLVELGGANSFFSKEAKSEQCATKQSSFMIQRINYFVIARPQGKEGGTESEQELLRVTDYNSV
jgi:hypothetical protein